MDVDWASLHKLLSDPTRRSILELLAEKETLTYTKIMTLLQITNTGRLNYHLKALNALLSKDEGGRYRLTEQGVLAASLLKSFPERIQPEKKLTAVKIVAGIFVVLLGVLLIATFIIAALGFISPVTSTLSAQTSFPSQIMPQNTTLLVGNWQSGGTPFGLAWNAASPIRVYVLNESQYDALLLQHASGGSVHPAVQNFTGPPTVWLRDYNLQTGNVSLTVPSGQYHFLAWSQTRTLLSSFIVSQHQSQPGASVSWFLYLYLSVFIALGALLVVVGVSILTRRVWR